MFKKFFIIIIFSFLFVMGLLVHCRFVSTKGLITKEYNIKTDNISTELKIIHFSDILFSRSTNRSDIEKIVEEIKLIEPDLIFFTGDLFNKNYKISAKDKKFLIDIFSDMDCTYGKYAILGDNDYDDIATIKDIYLNSDFKILDNDYDIIINDLRDTIFIGGVSSSNKKDADIDAIMNYFDNNSDIEYKIILLHEPDYIDNIIPKYSVNLILGGHSLNGQIDIPFIKRLFLQKGATKYYKNYYNLNNTDIYISSGIGVYKTNFRFDNKPSINYYRLNKK